MSVDAKSLLVDTPIVAQWSDDPTTPNISQLPSKQRGTVNPHSITIEELLQEGPPDI